MYDRKSTGVAIGEYKHVIIAHELGVVSKQEQTVFTKPILEGGSALPEDVPEE